MENSGEGKTYHKTLGRPVCRTKLPRNSFNFKTKNGPKNAPKLPRKSLSLVLLCRIFHRHYSKIFHREFPHKIKYFFTTRICRHGHAKKPLPLSGPNRAMQLRCAMRFESHIPKSQVMRFFFAWPCDSKTHSVDLKSQENARKKPAKILRCWPAMRKVAMPNR